MILSINLAILTSFKIFVQFSETFRVGKYKNLFIFFSGRQYKLQGRHKKKQGRSG